EVAIAYSQAWATPAPRPGQDCRARAFWSEAPSRVSGRARPPPAPYPRPRQATTSGNSQAGGTDALAVPVIGAAAPAQHVHPGESRADRRVLGAEFLRVPGIEIRRRVELGMAALRGVCADTAQPMRPVCIPEHVREVAGMGAIHHVVSGRA